ncbi:MarR family winged helix-turn-helix transcriptional regulator [Sphingomicrobium sp. XHP0239]|uniref:MarR family winged helix-turn-helix transcriptional regulator n=1 Tax=Sphingomicrobium maritimum TaxID=3133972 RepID=UPI0031CCB257
MNRETDFGNSREAILPPAIDVVADDHERLDQIARFVERLGIEVVERFLWQDTTVDRLGDRPVWIELDTDPGTALDHWLMAFDARSDSGEVPSAIALSADLLDAVEAVVGDQVELLVAPDEGTRAAAISMLAARGSRDIDGVAEAGSSDPEALRKLSEEVQRIAAALAQLSDESYDASPPAVNPEAALDAPDSDLSADTVRALIRARRMREQFFDKSLFHDPAWDMMLDLLAAEIAQHRVPVSSLCMAAAVPPTTALRWMKTMVDKKLFVRRSDPHDGRRVFVELSEQSSRALRAYFAKVGSIPAV